MVMVDWRAIKQKWLWGLVIVGLLLCGNSMWVHAKATLAQHLIASAWQQSLADGKPHKPWRWADSWPVARLKVPATGADLYVLAGAHGTALAFGTGHMDGTALPGASGTSVVGGHRDTHFQFLQNLQAGDWVLVQQPNAKWHSYQIQTQRIADIRKGGLTLPAQGDWLYLVTCYPFNNWKAGGSERYVVEARRVQANQISSKATKADASQPATPTQIPAQLNALTKWQTGYYSSRVDARLASAHF